jgi:hypothetical protein
MPSEVAHEGPHPAAPAVLRLRKSLHGMSLSEACCQDKFRSAIPAPLPRDADAVHVGRLLIEAVETSIAHAYRMPSA